MFSRLSFGEIHESLKSSVRGWSHAHLMPGAAERDRASGFDEALYRRLDTELGIMNITLPESLGGAGLDIAATILVIGCLSECDPGMAMSYLSQELLFSHQLYWSWQNSGQEMPARHADILKEKALSGMAMTEPDAGTDVLGMRTTAVPDEKGFILNGSKQWITNGPVGRYFLVYARTGEDRRDISLFLADSRTPGFSRSSCEEKMGMRSSPTGILTFDHCVLPPDSCVGGLHNGLTPMLRNLGVERLGLAAQSLGIARTCLETMHGYVTTRQAFQKPIVEFGQVQRMLSLSYTKYQAMKAMLTASLWEMLENSPRASLDSDATKLFCAEGGEEISRMAVQCLGANGYSSAYPVERLHRDAILLSIGGGTNEALQKNISRLLAKEKLVVKD